MIFCILSNIAGLFVIRWEITNKGDVNRIIEKCSRFNLNSILVQIYARGESLVKNPYFPLFEELRTDEDLLGYLIEMAKIRKIDVYGVINVFYVWSQTDFPPKKEHLTHRNKEWFVVDYKGFKNINMSVDELKERNLTGYFISPFIQIYIDTLINFIKYIESKYNLKGLFLDYIRYPGPSYGFENFMYDSLMREFYIDINDPLRYFLDFTEKDIIKYLKVSQITKTVKRIKSNTGLKLFAFVFPDPIYAKKDYFQDWESWLKEGYVDGVSPMIYTSNFNDYERRVKKLSNYNIIPTIGAFLCSNYEIQEEIDILKKHKINSFIIFSEGHLK